MKHVTITSAALAISVLVSQGAAAQARSFSYVDHNKKAGIETFTRTATSVIGDVVFDSTGTRVHYEGHIAPDGTMPRLDIRVAAPGASTKTQRLISVAVGRDSTRVVERLGSKADTIRVATQAGTMPFINFSTGITEVAIARARALKGSASAVAIPIVMALDFDTPTTAPLPKKVDVGPIEVTFAAGDTVRLGTPKETDRVRIAIGADGHARGIVNGSNAKGQFSGKPTSKAVPPR